MEPTAEQPNEAAEAPTTARGNEASTDTTAAPNNMVNGTQPSPGLRNSKGWDGKLRVDKTAVLANPEALSDPEYSDDENVNKGVEVPADEDLLDEEDPDAEEITATHSRVTSIPNLRLERFKQCARLCLRQNSISEIEGLDGIASTLAELDLYDNLISHVSGSGLAPLTKLTSLDLSFNKIKHVRHVSHLTELRDLYFVANKIGAIEGLAGLTKLRMLELGSNRIRELQNLDGLTALEELWVAKNKITSLSGLSGLPKLRLLSIQSNRIADLAPIRDVAASLEELYIADNLLESLAGIEPCAKLRILDLSNNKVAALAPALNPLADLEEVWASSNRLADFNDVEKALRDKKNLTTVYFEANPLQIRAPALYRNKVRLALPQIQQIDATFVKAP